MRELVCVVCPLGCQLEVNDEEGFAVTGNQCARGESYAKEELLDPRRVVTSTVKIRGAIYKRLPVKTSAAIPKARVMECMALINSIQVEAPIALGQPLSKDILGLKGVDLLASRSMGLLEEEGN